MISNEEIQQIAESITADLQEPVKRGWSLEEAAACCVLWCIIHKAWRDGTDLGMTKKDAVEQLHRGPLSQRSIGAIDRKLMNVTSAAQIHLESGMPIYNEGRYIKRGTNEDNGPMVCKGYAPAPNIQKCVVDILPRALLHFNLVPPEAVHSSSISSADVRAARSRISIDLPETVEQESVLEAINRIDADGIAPHRKNHTFELLHDGKGYPPLAVLAFALEHENDEVIPAGALRGEDSSNEFRLLRSAGFSISRIHREGQAEDEIQKEAHSRSAQPIDENAGSDRPEKRSSEVTQYDRDQNVVRAVLQRANGLCDGCRRESGFIRKSTGEPYLEVHHIKFLSDGGPDRAWNAVALCPNCHRRCHYADDREAFNDSLYEKVDAVHRSAPS